MYFLMLGVALVAMKYLQFGPAATLSWWTVLAPFALATAWWWWADSSGYTKKKAMQEEEARRQARVERSREAMGTLGSKKRR